MTIVRSLKEEKGEQRGGRVGVRWQDWVAGGSFFVPIFQKVISMLYENKCKIHWFGTTHGKMILLSG